MRRFYFTFFFAAFRGGFGFSRRYLSQRAFDAALAPALRSAALRLAARAFPPFRPILAVSTKLIRCDYTMRSRHALFTIKMQQMTGNLAQVIAMRSGLGYN